MSNEGSSTKWIVGCIVAGVLGMILCGGGLALVGWFSVQRATTTLQNVQVGMRDQMRAQQTAAAWQPPAQGAVAEELFPDDVGAWRRTEQASSSELEELNIVRDGQRGAYQSGTTLVEIYAYEVPAAEESALFDRATAAIDGYSFTSNYSTNDGISHRMTFSYSPPARQGRMWWCKGWLFVFLTDEEELDLDGFLEEYLNAIASAESTGVETLGAAPLEPEPPRVPQPIAEPQEPAPPKILQPRSQDLPD